MSHLTLDIILTAEPYDTWGPWRNQWGYTVEMARFQDGLIIINYVTPSGESGSAYFEDWESCERFVLLLDQDRRF